MLQTSNGGPASYRQPAAPEEPPPSPFYLAQSAYDSPAPPAAYDPMFGWERPTLQSMRMSREWAWDATAEKAAHWRLLHQSAAPPDAPLDRAVLAFWGGLGVGALFFFVLLPLWRLL